MSMSPRLLRPRDTAFSPRSISGLALWLDASSSDLYTTDAGPVTAVASPLDIAGCVGWYDASDSATLFDAQSGGSAVTTNGATVARWQDKSGGNRHLTQATANTGLPTLSTNALAGRNVVAFGATGTGAGFTMTDPVSRATHTVIAVYLSETGGDASGAIINDGGAGYGLLVTRGAGTNLEASSGNATIGSGRILANLSGSTTATIGPAISSWLHAGTPSVFQNGPSIGSATTSGSVSLSRVGYYAVSSTIFRLKGYIAELIIFDTALTTAQRASVESYLATKWGISGVHVPATASSDPVGYWGDRSGNGRHAVQATAGRRPGYLTTDANGKPAVSFSASFPSVITNEFTFANAVTVFAVAKNTNNSFGGFFQRGTVNERHSGFRNAGTITARRGSGNDATVPFTSSDYSVFQWSFGGSLSLPGVNGVSGTANTGSNTFASTAMPLRVGSLGDGSLGLIGGISEFLYYEATLTDSQAAAVRRYLARKYGVTLTVIPTVSNADAQDWINRVYANGGTVSAATAASVNQFCVDIENAPGGSIRDRFYRLNLFCGSNLNAALVPLYRGPSLGGTQYGGATDTNVGGLFVSGDYNETGASGGLNNAARTKYLDTGFATNTLSVGNRHLSAYARTWPNAQFDEFLGSENPFLANQFCLGHQSSADEVSFAFGSTTARINSGVISSGANWLGVESSTASGVIYRNGVSAVSGSLTTASPTSASIFVFANNRASTPVAVDFFGGTLGGYSIGLSMTAPQAAAYNTAMQSFQAALTRNV